MASYVDASLIEGETVLYRGHISIWSLMPYLVLGLVFAPVLGIGVIIWLLAWVKYKTTELAVTSRRLIAKFGFISRTTVELNIQKAESIQVIQSIFGRLLDYGTIVISGAGNPQAPIPGVSRPLEFRKAFLAAQEGALGKSPGN
jgi:uncharacterized membrane protein YdbT with pleckstrin-like domain